MRSISWPKMFSKNSTIVKEDHPAVVQNMKTLLLSEQAELKDDPFFGVALRKYMFDQNNEILRDMLIDEIYTQLALFMPQLKVERRDISIVSDGIDCRVRIRATNLLNYKVDTYNLVLFQEEER